MNDSKYHYVYKLTDITTNEFYYGSRSCDHSPDEDSDYMGSMVTWNPVKENLVKDLIEINFNTRDDAMLYENEIIKKYINDELNRNYATPYGKFYRLGPPVNKGVKNPNHSKRMTGENNPRYNKNNVAVIQYDRFGNFIKKWNSIREASTTLNIKYEYIKGCIFGTKRIVFGYMWRRYEGESYEHKIKPYKRSSKCKNQKTTVIDTIKVEYVEENHIPIYQYTMNGMFITQWSCLTIASRSTGIGVININNCLENITKSSGGFQWKYK